MGSKSEHAGHRERKRKTVLEYGIEALPDHEKLEVLLYYAIPMRDTNPLAHRLIDEFGSISAVFDAPYDVLLKSGISESTAFLLKYIPELLNVYVNDRYKSNNGVVDIDNLGDMFINKFIGKKNEMVYLLLMDSKYRELYCGIVSKGNNTNTDINITKICGLAVSYSARYAVISHNHPSGISLPSRSDIIATINLNKALKALNVRLLDHFVVADLDAVSLHDANLLFDSMEEYENSRIFGKQFPG